MSAAIENIPVNWIRPNELKDQLETAKVEFLGGSQRAYSRDDQKVIGYATTFFSRQLPQLTYWYTALEKLYLLPDLVPTLPENFHEIYFGNCPIKEMEGNVKVDGEPYKLYETHSLYLIPTMSLNDLEKRVSAYGRNVLGAKNDAENPLRFRNFYHRDLYRGGLFGSIKSDPWEWILIPNEVLEVSRGKTFSQQLETLETLNQRVTVGPNYDLGTLKQVAAFLFLHKVATGKSFYEKGNAQNGNRPSYVRAQETDEDSHHFIIGGYARSGVYIADYTDDWVVRTIGVAALRKLSS